MAQAVALAAIVQLGCGEPEKQTVAGALLDVDDACSAGGDRCTLSAMQTRSAARQDSVKDGDSSYDDLSHGNANDDQGDDYYDYDDEDDRQQWKAGSIALAADSNATAE